MTLGPNYKNREFCKMKCQYCENKLPDDAAFCPSCGAPATPEKSNIEAVSDRSWFNFMLFTVFLGWSGFQYIYIRKTTKWLALRFLLFGCFLLAGLITFGVENFDFRKFRQYFYIPGFALIWIIEIAVAFFIKKDGDGKPLKK